MAKKKTPVKEKTQEEWDDDFAAYYKEDASHLNRAAKEIYDSGAVIDVLDEEDLVPPKLTPAGGLAEDEEE